MQKYEVDSCVHQVLWTNNWHEGNVLAQTGLMFDQQHKLLTSSYSELFKSTFYLKVQVIFWWVKLLLLDMILCNCQFSFSAFWKSFQNFLEQIWSKWKSWQNCLPKVRRKRKFYRYLPRYLHKKITNCNIESFLILYLHSQSLRFKIDVST